MSISNVSSPVPSDVPAAPEVVPAPSVTGDWLTQTARLVRWNLFQAWRRMLTKVLFWVMLGIFALYIIGLALLVAATQAQGPDAAPFSGLLRPLLTFPVSIATGTGYIGFMGVVVLSIVVGAVVGGEYGNSTQRLALSRGVGRGQALAAQVAMTALLSLLIVAGIMVLCVLIGLTVGPVLGATPDGMSFGAIGQLLGYWGAISLRLFDYSLIALFLATVGRSAIAGIGGALGFMFVESIVTTGLRAAISVQRLTDTLGGSRPDAPLSGVAQTLTTILNLLLQPNADALGQAAQLGPLNLSPATDTSRLTNLLLVPPSATQAFLVMLAYAVALIGGSYLLVRARDVTD